MSEAIKREGKNFKIQGSNADIVKLALGCGFDDAGKAFLWHSFRPDRKYAYSVNLVHDEVVTEAPDKNIVEADGWQRMR